MNNPEFSAEFDILYNNIMSNAAPGLDEYEKSKFLTDAQENYVKELYNGAPTFEGDEEVRRYLGNLLRTFETSEKLIGQTGISRKSIFFELPDDVMFITYESVTLNDSSLGCLNGNEAVVVPVTQDTYYKCNRNPFRGPTENRVLRLDNSSYAVELISDYNIGRYFCKYLKRPRPIILTDLTTIGDNITIEGQTEESECELHPATHRPILERAVMLAKLAWSSGAGQQGK